MKVTVRFGRTGVVVPCKDGWMVRDLMEQATQRYRKLLEQDGEFLVRTHHVEYADGGILDPDDMLSDLLEDKDKLIAVFEETELQRRGAVSPGESEASGYSSPYASEPELGVLRPAMGTEIEVTSRALKSNTPLMVRSSSELVLPRSPDFITRDAPYNNNNKHTTTGLRGGAMDSARTDGPTTRGGPIRSSLTRTVDIFGDMGPLGIKVVPYCSSLSGRPLGLNVKSIEENSRTKKEGILHEDESIVQINDVTLMDKSFAESQEVFRQAMMASVVRLEVLPTANKLQYEKSLIGQIFSATDAHGLPKTKSPFLLHKTDSKPPEPTPSQTPPPRPSPVQTERRRETPSPSLRTSPSPRSRSESPALTALTNPANKKGAKKKITLTKGPDGLGFTVVTRDSSVHGPGPILVKSILSRGAAIRDGRLQSGDRILEVNGTDITGFRQEDLVSMLRATKQGDTVSLVVSRAEDLFLPRELKADPVGPPRSQDGVEQLLLDIPVSDSGSAGLGVSLKGNKSRETGEDLGIFIKSIIHGGAAFKDGRLRVNDQLVAVNGESLLGRSNHEAMETLRRSMSVDGNLRDTIQLLIFRPLNRSPAQDVQVRESAPSVSVGSGQSNGVTQPPMVINSIYGSTPGHALRSRVYEEEDYSDEDLPTPPSDLDPVESAANHNQRYQQPRYPVLPAGHPTPTQNILRAAERGPSKSMDLVPNEGNLGAMQTHRPAPAYSLGPTLGLRKSSSLESLQSAMEEVSKTQVPFHRPAGPMVRGRGCNMSFRQAIDKSYDGPSEPEDDDSEDSGRETPASSSSRQELDDLPKDKKKKTKKKKEKKSKSKKKDDPEEAEKKPKKKGFGLLRFGKKNKEGKSKGKMGSLSEEELEKSEAEIGSHGTLQRPGHSQPLDVEDDDYDPNYARINHFRDPPSSGAAATHPANVLPPQYVPPTGPAYNNPPPHEDPLEGLYAKVNKMKPTVQQPSSSNEARLQQIRSQLQSLKPLPSYGETGAVVVRAPEYNPARIRGPDPRSAVRYEDADGQNSTLPRRVEDQKDASRLQNPYQSQTGPFRYDVPSSLGPRAAPSYESAMRSRTPDPEQYGAYGEGQYPNHGHKNPAIGAV